MKTVLDVRRPSRKRRVLLVDADGIIRRTLGRLLRGAGFDVAESGSANQALDPLKQGAVELAIVDAKAPGVGGHRLHERFAAIQPAMGPRSNDCYFWDRALGPVPDSCSPVNVNVNVPVPEMRNGVSGCADREGCSSITNDWTSMS